MSERGRSRSSERRHSRRRRSPSRSPHRRHSHKHRRHEREEPAEKRKLQNREEVAHRSRMWTVVDSEEDSSPKKDIHRSHGRHHSRRRSPSSSSSDSDSDSDSSDDGRKRKHKHKDKKKHKKHKKKDKKSRKDGKKHAVNQDEYGKYGILRESDFHSKSVSFQSWLRDVKKMGEFNGPKWEAMELFKEYMEDYNTCTLPHEKYYDVEKYEMKLYHKQQRKALSKQKGAADKALDNVADEERVRRDRQTAREKKEQEEFRLVMQLMDKDKIEAMRDQERLRAQMQLMYKSGDVGEARRLEQMLNKVEEDPRFKRGG